ncbi:MAG: nucleotidyltransferase domain-containing protein [Chlorobi bacterium]|nr:nucleotidyltransferase domain-containing protein [Chlorobiota bacterium]
MELIDKHSNQLLKLCDRFHVIELYVFGSVATGSTRPDSDVDLLVEFGNVDIENYFDNYLEFKASLEKLFKRKVDLLEKQTLKNPILIKSINRNKRKLYERADTEMAL